MLCILHDHFSLQQLIVLLINVCLVSTAHPWNVRHSKYDPIVDDEIDLLANPQYAFAKLQDGRETTVSTKQLAPAGDVETNLLNNVEINSEYCLSKDAVDADSYVKEYTSQNYEQVSEYCLSKDAVDADSYVKEYTSQNYEQVSELDVQPPPPPH